MVELRCADSGTICTAVLRASSKEEVLRAMADHLSREHRVSRPTGTIMNYMAGLVKPVVLEAPASSEGAR